MPLKLVPVSWEQGNLPFPRFALLNSEHAVVGVLTQPESHGAGPSSACESRQGNGGRTRCSSVSARASESPRDAGDPAFAAGRRLHRRRIWADPEARASRDSSFGSVQSARVTAATSSRHCSPVRSSDLDGRRDDGRGPFQIEPALDSGPMVGRVERRLVPLKQRAN